MNISSPHSQMFYSCYIFLYQATQFRPAAIIILMVEKNDIKHWLDTAVRWCVILKTLSFNGLYIGEVRSCLDIKEKLNKTQDGEYTILVGQKHASIYCHNMTSHRPREFLTLHNQNLMDSYSEIFPRRLILPYKCPSNETKEKSCEDNHCVKLRTECNMDECIEEWNFLIFSHRIWILNMLKQ